MTRAQRVILAIVIWLIAIAAAASLDARVAALMRDCGIATFLRSHDVLTTILKAPGEFYFTAIVAALVGFAHPLRWRAAGFLVLATVVSGMNALVKWLVGRTRPFKLEPYNVASPFSLSPLRGGMAGMFQSKNLCFPSGHAALAFATAAAVAILWPRSPWRFGAYAIAAVVAAERVAENAHWLSDSVAAAALGIGGVYLIHRIVTKLFVVKDEDARVGDVPLSGNPSRLSHE